MAKKHGKKKAMLGLHEVPHGKQWAHKKSGGKKKSKNLAKLTSKMK
jgi:hypothetical protein